MLGIFTILKKNSACHAPNNVEVIDKKLVVTGTGINGIYFKRLEEGQGRYIGSAYGANGMMRKKCQFQNGTDTFHKII